MNEAEFCFVRPIKPPRIVRGLRIMLNVCGTSEPNRLVEVVQGYTEVGQGYTVGLFLPKQKANPTR